MTVSVPAPVAAWLAGAAPLAPPHEGHGHAAWQSTFWHYVLEPVHAIPLAIGVACALAGAAWLVRRARRRARSAR